jgi:hypothetical protein
MGTCNIALIEFNEAQVLPSQCRNDFFDYRNTILCSRSRTQRLAKMQSTPS